MRAVSVGCVLLVLLSGCGVQQRRIADNPRLQSYLARGRAEAEARADAQFNEENGGRNATAEFRELFAASECELTDQQQRLLSKYRVLIVHGLLGEVGLKFTGLLNTIDKKQRLIDYLKDQQIALGEMQLECETLAFKSQAVAKASVKVLKAILKSPKPVIILSHSKGCVDTLDALLTLQRDNKLERVAGWIPMQGVFYGSKMADEHIEDNFKGALAHIAIKCLGGDYKAIRDLTVATREEYQRKHAAEIAALVKRVPVLCFASWKPRPEKERSDKACLTPWDDGQVTPRSSILPGTDYIAKHGISHSMPVIRSATEFDRVAFTKTLIIMLARRMVNSPPK